MASGIVEGAQRVTTRLVLEHQPGFWFFLGLALAAAFLLLQYRHLAPGAPREARWALLASRLLLFGAALFFLLGPTVLRQRLASLGTRTTILVDTSRSMSLPYEGQSSRLEQARRVLKRLAEEGGKGGLRLFGFDESARPVTLQELEGLKAAGGSTDLLGAMAEAAGEGEPGDAVVVLTDGRHNGAASAAPAGRRWVLVGIGSREPLADLRVATLKVADLGFQGKPVEVAATVGAQGFGDIEVPVTLKVDGKLVAVQQVDLAAGGEREVSFSWTPRATGSFRLTVEARPQTGEKVTENNRREANVRVARDRTRVLFISGTPSWNYRFLREALKRDPTLDLISFIILRGPADIVNVPQEELALIPFPTQKLFTEELESFELVIFENFNFGPYLPREYLDRLRDHIREGGAFWIFGGPLSFANGGYRGTAVEEVLPFTLEGAMPGEGYVQQPFRAEFTQAASAGLLFPPSDRTSPGGKPWDELPPLSGFNLTGPARPGATVLVEHPSYRSGGRPQPIVAMNSFGKGRVMAVATDYLWNWDFEAAGTSTGNRLYLEFIKNSVRWLTGDPVFSPVKLTVDPEEASAGEKVTARIRVLDDNFRPVGNASLNLEARDEHGARFNLKAAPSREEGIYEAEFRLPAGGSWRFVVEAAGPSGRLGEASALLLAAGHQRELDAPDLDERFLAGLAESAGGRYIPFSDTPEFYAKLDETLREGGGNFKLLSQERIGLGSLPLAAALLLGLLAFDWAVRKRYRLE